MIYLIRTNAPTHPIMDQNESLNSDEAIDLALPEEPQKPYEFRFYCFRGAVAEKLSVIILGLGFMFIFAAFNTTTNYSMVFQL